MKQDDAGSAPMLGSVANHSAIPNSWIPVTERLPEGNDEMVILTDGKWVTFGSRSGEGWYVHEDAEALGPARLDRFSHWMPLPAPPETSK